MADIVHMQRQLHRRVPVEARLLPPVHEIEGILRDERGEMDQRERQLIERAVGDLYQAVAWRRTREMARAAAYPNGGAPE